MVRNNKHRGPSILLKILISGSDILLKILFSAVFVIELLILFFIIDPKYNILSTTKDPPAPKIIRVVNKLVATKFEVKGSEGNLPLSKWTITDKIKIKLLLYDIYNLPISPPENKNLHPSCPKLNGNEIGYILDFYKDDNLLLHAVYNTFCIRRVSLDNKEYRSAMNNEGRYFNDDLRHVLNI